MHGRFSKFAANVDARSLRSTILQTDPTVQYTGKSCHNDSDKTEYLARFRQSFAGAIHSAKGHLSQIIITQGHGEDAQDPTCQRTTGKYQPQDAESENERAPMGNAWIIQFALLGIEVLE
jgi:hypothetical protein